MDVFFAPGGIFHEPRMDELRIPFAGALPPPGFTLVQDSIFHVQLDPRLQSSYGYFSW